MNWRQHDAFLNLIRAIFIGNTVSLHVIDRLSEMILEYFGTESRQTFLICVTQVTSVNWQLKHGLNIEDVLLQILKHAR